ncbi:MAG: XRE family transcriptional regulator [Brevibacterium sp.]|nr:XRE family transcriptional regulator [Brevibacterium sp.]MDN5908392.1 XRE family transcriptional regulator [Brevibacterium sp.]MDN6135274.1 XRE family transcriptional regulator [Brevibacterium sp.]MDN6603422.1 XRE family transcriptional regulator [Brevibacterium sp.]MDN6665604.1 XRE family transcriptional regulator [Brevibacterium sp.]
MGTARRATARPGVRAGQGPGQDRSLRVGRRLAGSGFFWQGKTMSNEQIFDGPLARAARALVRVSAKDVASKANVKKSELKDFEKGLDDFTELQEHRVLEALEEFGARFVRDDSEGGYGVRLKFNRAKVRAIERWEDEGGTSADDDV